jgi:amino acid adenylation domain-containing protein
MAFPVFPHLPSPNYYPLADSTLYRKLILSRASASSISNSTIIRTAWILLIARYTSCDETVFETRILCESPEEISAPLCVRLSDYDLSKDFLYAVQEEWEKLRPSSPCNFEGLGLPNNKSRNQGIFQNLLLVREDRNSFKGRENNSKFEEDLQACAIAVSCEVEKHEIAVKASFDTNVISKKQVDRFISQLDHIIQQICLEESHQKLRDVEEISLSDVEEIWGWNEVTPQTVDSCLHCMIKQRVLESPYSQAVCAWDGDLTYELLDELSSRVADHLVSLGVKSEEMIPLCFEKSKWVAVAILGVIKAGGAFVLLDASQPVQRLETICDQIEAQILLCSTGTSTKLTHFTGKPIIIAESTIERFPVRHRSCCQITAEDALYAIFTSGTTGTPKGAVISHRAFCTAASSHIGVFDIDSTSRVFQFASYSFDACLLEILTTLLAGGCVCIPSEKDRLDQTVRIMNEMGVTWCFQSPSFARTMNAAELSSLKTLIVGGEPLKKDVINQWSGRLNLIQAYGPSECTVISLVNPKMEEASDPANIGYPVTGARCWITDLNDHERLAPIGALGELLIEGPMLARGYLNDPEKTATSFVSCPQWMKGPFAAASDSRLYRTGDIVRYNSDGSINFVGRKDTQVKIRGQRIELGEVEYRIRDNLAEPADVTVELISPKCMEGRKMLAAFLCVGFSWDNASEDGQAKEAMKLRFKQLLTGLEIRLSKSLPAYMIPNIYIPIKRTPLMVSGKTDRKELLQMVAGLSIEQLSHLAILNERSSPASAMELKLQNLWGRVLKLPTDIITVQHSFFSLGGDSIGVIQLVQAALKDGLLIHFEDIFRNHILSDMATVVTQSDNVVAADILPFELLSSVKNMDRLRNEVCSSCQIPTDQLEDVYPCTPLQEGLMALSAERGTYVSQFVYKIPESLNVGLFRAAWSRFAQQNSILRTRIVQTTEYSLVQVVLAQGLSWLNGTSLETYCSADKQKPMELGDPLARCAIIEGSDGISYFVWTAHHAIYDGWSLPNIFNGVESIYKGSTPGPTLGLKYFIKYLKSIDRSEAQEFWRCRLSGAQAQSFPQLPTATYRPLANAVLKHNIVLRKRFGSDLTLPTVIRAAWALVVASYSNSSDVVFGATVNGRAAHVPGIDTILGPTIATIPVRVQFTQEQSVEDLLHTIQNQAIASTPFEQIGLQAIAKIDSHTRAACNFQNLLIIQNPQESEVTQNSLGLCAIITEVTDILTFALTLDCTLISEGVVTRADYDSTVIQESQVKRTIFLFEHILQQLCNLEQDGRIKDIELISSQDKLEICSWNLPAPELIFSCIHHIIERQAQIRPTSPAIYSWDAELTYADLDRLSTQVAQHLQSLKVSPETFVLLCFDKSAWYIVAMIAVLKAGGAFVPLDPSHPPARLASIVQDVKGNVILCSEKFFSMCSKLTQNSIIINGSIFSHMPTAMPILLANVSPNNAAYAVFTSGSTGTPKGSVIEHKAYSSGAFARRKAIRRDEKSRVLQFSSYSFDTSIEDILTTLMFGGCVCSPSEHDRLNDLAGFIKSARVNSAELTPSFVKLISPESVPTLEVLLLGGEAVTKVQRDQWAETTTLINSYGPSECSVTSVVSSPLTPESDPTTIGNPIGCLAWIVSPSNPEVLMPVGSVGELLLEGPILARCYLNNPKETAEVFIEDLSWARKADLPLGRRFYRTGDLVRYQSDGTIKFIGRNDTQVKVRGQRVELSEIEYHLARLLPSPIKVVVEMVQFQHAANDETKLVAFLGEDFAWVGLDNVNGDVASTLSDQQRLKPVIKNILSDLSNSVPSYMIPSFFVSLETLPLSTSGKVDRKRLRQIGGELSREQLAALATPSKSRRIASKRTEKLLQGLWSNILGVEKVSIGPYDNFFHMGGDSINAIRLVAGARDAGLLISAHHILTHPRLSDMALGMSSFEPQRSLDIKPFALLAESGIARCIHEVAQSCKVSEDLIEDIYPCTALQEGLMALSLTNDGSYVAHEVFELPPALDVAQFQDSWGKVAQHHPILRTRIIQLSQFGALQAVLKEAVLWQVSNNLLSYLESLKKRTIEYGHQLVNYAIVNDSATRQRYFVWTIHHAIYDGWSLPQILQDVEQVFYNAAPNPTTGFNNFIKYLKDVDQAASKEFWSTQLTGILGPSFPNLPGNSYRPSATASLNYSFDLPRHPESEITQSTMIYAAWALIVSRYSDMDDVVFGITLSGRTAPVQGIECMTGPTIATVPFRVRFDPKQEIRILLQDIQKLSYDMIPYEQIGLQNIRRLHSDAEAACTFQSLIVVQPPADSSVQQNTLGLSQLNEDSTKLKTYALSLELVPSSNGLQILTQFDPEVVMPTEMQRILQQFEHVLQQLYSKIDSANQNIEDLEIISPADLATLKEWNQDIPETMKTCVHQLIEERISIQPKSPAISSWDGDLTYLELNYYSNRLAHYLVSLGIGPETMVPVCFEKSKWTIVAILGILKAGGAFVPMDPSNPINRLETISSTVDAKVVLSSVKTSQMFSESIQQLITIVNQALIDSLPHQHQAPSVKVGPQNAVYVIFTSGSTGTPKGVIIEHGAYSTSATMCAAALHIQRNSRVLQFASYSFDVSVQEILATLIVGGCICVPDDADRLNDIYRIVREMGITWMNPTPAFARLIEVDSVHDLETMVFGGEAPNRNDIDHWADKVLLVNAYGVTECSVTNIINVGVKVGTNPRNIGRAIGGACWVVDANNTQQLAPLGSVGELLIEGPFLARGYLKDSRKTQAAFIQAPKWLSNYRPTISTRMYRTGDLVRYNHDGTIHYIGRKDAQVKISGQRIELGEIEHFLRQFLPAVIEVAVEVIKPKTVNRSILAAFISLESISILADLSNIVTLKEDAKRNIVTLTAGLESYLLEFLPAYMVPSVYIPVSRMPLTIAGKTDRGQLRSSVSEMSMEDLSAFFNTTIEKQPPVTEMEKEIAKLWCKTLNIGLDAIGINSNYFRLGGNSISAIQLVATARTTRISLTVEDIFKNPILSGVALVAQFSKDALVREVAPFELVKDSDELCREVVDQCNITRSAIEDIYQCTPLQDGLMALSVLDPGTYVSQFVWLLPESLDVERFRAAWNIVLHCNPILRTRICHSSAGTIQVVVKEPTRWEIPLVLDEYLLNDKNRIIGIGQPMIRFAIIDQILTDRRYFAWTAHHAVFDGWSVSLIMESLEQAYQGTVELHPKPSFNAFIKYLADMDHDEAENFWRSQLAGSPPSIYPAFPSATYRPIAQTIVNAKVHLPSRPKSEITMSTMVKAAWSLLLAKYCDSNDVVFGITTSGRAISMPCIEEIVGPTIASMPFRVRFNNTQYVKDFLGEIQTQSTKMIPFEHIGLQNIKKLSEGSEAACGFRTLLVIQPSEKTLNRANDVLDLSPITGKPANFHAYPLALECRINLESVSITAEFDSNLINKRQMERMVGQFSHILKQICSERSGIRILDITAISSSDIQEIWSWNSQIPLRIGSCMHYLIEEQARKQPTTLAIESWDGQLTYKELEDKSTYLAREIAASGIGTTSFVPLCFEKSLWAIVSMLAVWKAGAACVFLDPSYPKSRRETLIKDISAPLILSSPLHAHLFTNIEVPTTIVQQSFFEDEMLGLDVFNTKVLPSFAAYVVFTSGSTGQPKAIIVEHAALCTSSKAMGVALKLGPFSRALQFSAYTFDVSYADICPTLIYGGCICIPSEYDRMNNLTDSIKSMRVNQAILTPSVVALLEPNDIRSLQILGVGGEAMSKESVEKWSPHVHLVVLYGPAECTIVSVGREGIKSSDDPCIIGRGIGSIIWIVDANDHNKLAPVGAVGELVIEGPILARGYLNDEPRTERSFIENPAWLPTRDSETLRRRMYLTGDLVHYMADGSVKIIGRKDTQVKLEGRRIELGEIEHHVQQALPSKPFLAVELVKSADGNRPSILAAFLRVESNYLPPDQEDGKYIASSQMAKEYLMGLTAGLEARLLQSLPTHMVPSAFIPMRCMPLLTSGKLDRKQLREIASSLTTRQLFAFSDVRQLGGLPSTENEILLQKLWVNILKVSPGDINLRDNFFRLGGDSITAMRLVTAARNASLQLTVESIFKNPIFSDMALILNNVGERIDVEIPPFGLLGDRSVVNSICSSAIVQCNVQDSQIEDIYPCTPFQSDLMRLSYQHPGYPILRSVYSLGDGIDLEKLRTAWESVVESQSILRTRIIDSPRGLFQVVLNSRTSCRMATDLEMYISADETSEMGLGKSLNHCAIIDEGSSNRYLVWTSHHALYDGWSIQLLIAELWQAYDQGISTTSKIAFNKCVKYVLDTPRTTSDAFWKSHLSGTTSNLLWPIPANYQPTASSSLRLDVIIEKATYTGITVPTILQAAWAFTLANRMQVQEVVLELTLTGRHAAVPNIEKMMAPTATTVPLRVQVDQGLRAREFLQKIQSQLAEMIPFEHTGWENIKNISQDARRACESSTPIVIHPYVDNAAFGKIQLCSAKLMRSVPCEFLLDCMLTTAGIALVAHFDERVVITEEVKVLLCQLDAVFQALNSTNVEQRMYDIDLGRVRSVGDMKYETLRY